MILREKNSEAAAWSIQYAYSSINKQHCGSNLEAKQKKKQKEGNSGVDQTRDAQREAASPVRGSVRVVRTHCLS
jgi:hypothetical protein